MPKKKKIMCKKCKTVVDLKENPPNKTWNIISPMPDKEGRVTVTIMGSFSCANCGASIRTSIQKIKGDNFSTGKSKKQEMLEIIETSEEPIEIDELSTRLGMNTMTIKKALAAMIKKGLITGTIEGEVFVPKNR
ncbi:MAG: hypothetical protein ACFFDT_10985 [Candidatus Hodarchaeota archaeon]